MLGGERIRVIMMLHHLREEISIVSVTTLTEEITATALTSPDEAVRQAVARATSAMTDIESVEVKRVEVLLDNSSVVGYRVSLEVTRSAHLEEVGESEETAGHPTEPPSYGKKSQLELVRRRVLLEDLSQEDIDKSERFLTITPSEWGSGSSDVSINHDWHLFED
jgi:flavin-binding protein dodecin